MAQGPEHDPVEVPQGKAFPVSLSNILMCWLAVFGCSVTISTLDGPFGVCADFRKWMQASAHAWARKGVSCPICVSFWVAPVIAALFVNPVTLTTEQVQLWLSSVGFTATITWLSPPADPSGHTPPVA